MTTSAQPSASGTASGIAAHRRSRRARPPAPAPSASDRRRRGGSPCAATCGASRPAPQPRSTRTAPARPAGGTSRARASAIQCSIANSAVRAPPFAGQVVVLAEVVPLAAPAPCTDPSVACDAAMQQTCGHAPPMSTRARAHRVTGLVRACHPEPAVAVTLGAALLAVAVGRDAGRCRRGRRHRAGQPARGRLEQRLAGRGPDAEVGRLGQADPVRRGQPARGRRRRDRRGDRGGAARAPVRLAGGRRRSSSPRCPGSRTTGR